MNNTVFIALFSFGGFLLVLFALCFLAAKLKTPGKCSTCNHDHHKNYCPRMKLKHKVTCDNCSHFCHKATSKCPQSTLNKQQRTTYKTETKKKFETKVVGYEDYEEDAPAAVEVEVQKRQYEKDGVTITEDVVIQRTVAKKIKKTRPKYGQVEIDEVVKVPQIEYYTETIHCQCSSCQCSSCLPRMESCGCKKCKCDYCSGTGFYAKIFHVQWISALLWVLNGLAVGIYACVESDSLDTRKDPFFISSMIYFSFAGLVTLLGMLLGVYILYDECCSYKSCCCECETVINIVLIICMIMVPLSTIVTLAAESRGYDTSYYEVTNIIPNDYSWGNDWWSDCDSEDPMTISVDQYGLCYDDIDAVSSANRGIVGVIVTSTLSLVFTCCWGLCQAKRNQSTYSSDSACATQTTGFIVVALNVISLACACLAIQALRDHLVDDLNEHFDLDLPGWSGEYTNPNSGLQSKYGPANGYTMFAVGVGFGCLSSLTSLVVWICGFCGDKGYESLR